MGRLTRREFCQSRRWAPTSTCQKSTVCQDLPGQTRPDVLVTRTSKAMSSTELPCAGEVANALSPRVPLCANPRLLVVLNSRNLCETFNQLLKNVLDVVCWV